MRGRSSRGLALVQKWQSANFFSVIFFYQQLELLGLCRLPNKTQQTKLEENSLLKNRLVQYQYLFFHYKLKVAIVDYSRKLGKLKKANKLLEICCSF